MLGQAKVLVDILRKHGVGGLYHGIASELVRGVLFHAVNMVTAHHALSP
jgi:hypothetical protein